VVGREWRWLDDLIVMGEFMAIEVFLNKAGKSLEQAHREVF